MKPGSLPIRIWITICVTALVATAAGAQGGLIAGPNVNMVSGTTWPDGDPFLQRQNEPACAVSTRNPLHILCGANDYRTVDIPGLPEGKPTGDSWIGVFTSLNGGGSWTSTLLPCYPQDASLFCSSLPSSIFSLEAAADPVMRAGVQGFLALSGILFARGLNPQSTVFVSRFIDLNNDPYIPIQYYDTQEVWSYPPGSPIFIDKPWLAIDIPRGSASKEFDIYQDGTLVEQTLQCGPMYLAWAEIESDGVSVTSSKIMFSSSTDCGDTWSTPQEISAPNTVNQGATIAIEPTSGYVHVAWRQFSTLGLPDYCVRGPGFWKTHPEVWASTSLYLGGYLYTPVQLLGILEAQPKGDATYILAKQLIAAKLNQLDTLDPITVAGIMAQADAWLVAHPLGSKPKKATKQEGIDLANLIKPFNTGVFGPGLCEPGPGTPQNAVLVASSSDGGSSFAPAVLVSALEPFDQGTTTVSFRSSAYPTMTADETGRLYLAWTTRGVAIPGADPDPVSGDARIVVSTSLDGFTWTGPQPIDEPMVPGHEIKPSITYTAGKLLVGYYDFREDVSGVFEGFVADLPGYPSRHTVDVRAAIAEPGDVPVFTTYPVLQSTQTSRYPFIMVGSGESDAEMMQLQWNPPNLPMFRSGTVPFFSDYLDLAPAPPFVSDRAGNWSYNTDPSITATAYEVWTDDRDVIPPPDGDWTNYFPPTHSNSGGTSIFDGATSVPDCLPGSDDEDRTGMRNQNVYSARLTEGLYVAAPGNSRPLGILPSSTSGDLFQRAYVIFVQNTTYQERSFRLTIDNQPPDLGQASFDQFAAIAQTELDVTIEPQSSASRTVFLSSSSSQEAIEILVQEIDYPGGSVIGGLESSVLLNPDPSNPDPLDPSLNQEEIYNPAIYNPAILNPAILNPAILNPAILNPAILNPAILNPAIHNPAILNPAILNPAILNPAIYNPAILNPAILNPAIYNPAILNPAIYNTTMTDVTWEMTNDGNAPVAYSLNLSAAGILPTELIFQLMVYRVYTTPVSSGCDLTEEAQHELLVNVTDPNFAPLNLFDPNVDDPNIVSFYLEPGDTVLITLRVIDPDADNNDVFNPAQVQTVVVAQGVNTAEALLGETQQPYAVPDASIPSPYTMNTGRVQHTTTLLPDGKVLVTGGFNPVQTESSAEIYDPATGQFTATGSMNTARAWHTATLLYSGEVLIFGGETSGPKAELYDPVTGTFSPAPMFLPGPTGSHRATRLADGRVLITGGMMASPSKVALTYDPSLAPALRFKKVGSMSSSRWEHTATLLTDGRVLVTGGFGNTAEIFDPTGLGTFTAVPGTMSDSRRFHSATLLPNGKVLIAGGILDAGPLTSTDSADIYDPATNTLTPAADMFDVHAAHITELLPNGKVLIAGGSDAPGGVARYISTVELYDWSTDTFSLAGDLAEARTEHAAARLLSGDILITGGTTPGPPVVNGTDTFEIYHPGLPPKFLLTDSLNEGRSYHTVTPLLGGDVLVVGGADGDINAISSLERYDPSLGTFTTVATLSPARMLHSATRLDDGTVLIAGGLDGLGGTVLNTALIYNPTDHSLTPTTGSLNVERFHHSATLLADGKVLIVAGNTTGNTSISSAEIYDPAVGTFTLSGSLNTFRRLHTATLLNDGRVLIAGGRPNVGATDTFQVWDPGSGLFGPEGAMNDQRYLHKATLLADGAVLITGGAAGVGSPLDTVELFDPASDTFSYAVGDMKIGRRAHASIRLPSGEVLIAGGSSDGLVLLSEAEVYDPITQTFALTDVLNVARSGPRATRLTDGRVLLVGGWESFGVLNAVASNAAEIYDPSADANFFLVGQMTNPHYAHSATK
ncbi:MAG: kelch repeat-containing protein, partial [Thermoanaerobaculia bacterium]